MKEFCRKRSSFVLFTIAILFVFQSTVTALFAQFTYEVHDEDGIPVQRYKERRQKLLETMNEKSVFLAFAADVRNRQNDVDFEYRQSSEMLYLCGLPEPNTILMLVPGGVEIDSGSGKMFTEIAFVPKRNPQRELWTGIMLGVEKAEELYGIKALERDKFDGILRRLLTKRDTLFIAKYPTQSVKEPVFGGVKTLQTFTKEILEQDFPHVKIRTRERSIAAMREIKDSDELRLLRKAVDISIEAHKACMRAAKPGMHEYELEALMEYFFKKQGAESVGYGSIVGSAHNGCILHYETNRRKTKKGELVLMDCGAEYHGYTADVTRTFPMNGTFSDEQKILYNIVLEAADSAIAACRAGVEFREPHKIALRIIERKLRALNILGENEDVKKYFPHGTSHSLGLDVHDPQTGRTLANGYVLTVEPGIYIPPGSPCDKKWWNIGIRIEDDILVTNSEPENLSGALPRTVSDIENIMKSMK